MASRWSSPLLALISRPSPTLSTDTLFDLLSNKRRRNVYHYLRQQDGAVDIADLCDTVAAWEYGTTPDDLPKNKRQRVYVTLFQSHLPKLDEADIVEFDAEAGVVELSENAEDFEVYLEVVATNDIPWPQYYLGLVAVSTLFMLLVWIDVPPFTIVSDTLWLLIMAVFAVSAVVHYRNRRGQRLGTEGAPPDHV